MFTKHFLKKATMSAFFVCNEGKNATTGHCMHSKFSVHCKPSESEIEFDSFELIRFN